MARYTAQLKERHKSGYILENNWPPFISEKFINLGYIIHKPERTAQEAKKSAKSATSGREQTPIHMCNTFGSVDEEGDSDVTIEEEIAKIILPIKRSECPQIILIEGVPGIGKTMLMKEIRHLWANDQILKDTKVLLLFSLRDPKINNFKSIKAIFYQLCKIKEDAEIYAKYFERNNGEGLAILLDGLDENPQAMQRGTFLHDVLIEQKIFQKACVIITSRPHETTKLQQLVSYRVEIIGFTKDRRQDFVRENLKEKAKDLLNYLEDNAVIDTLCYIPLNMSIIVYLSKAEVQLKDLPNNQTELTRQAIRMTVFHYLEELELTESQYNLENLPKPFNEVFYYLSELAFNAMVNKKLIFTRNEISKACPVQANSDDEINVKRTIVNGLGLLQATQFITEGAGDTELLSNFAHYSVQELLAAWYIAFSHRSYFHQLPLPCSIQKGMQNCLQFSFQLRVLKASFWKGHYIDVWSFYIGLTGGNDPAFKHFLTSNMFSYHMPHKSFSRLHRISSYMSLQETTQNDIIDHMDVVECTKKNLRNKLRVLLLYYYLREAPDNKVIKHFDAVVTKDELDISEQILDLQQDLYLLGNILSRPYLTKQWKKVILSYCQIDDKKFRILYEVLTRNDGRFKPKIEALSLSGNKLKSCSDDIANLVCRQEILHLDLSNNILEDFISLQRCDFLVTLDISGNKLDGKNVAESLKSLRFLRNLKVLKLKQNEIKQNDTDDSQNVIDAIGLVLCSCNSLEELELDGNDGEFVEKTMLLFKVIKKIRNSKSDEHYYNGQSDTASAFLKILKHCNEIVDDQPQMCTLLNIIIQSKLIDISGNRLKSNNGCSLGKNLLLLVNLKTLNITENDISDEATKSLTTGMLFTRNLKQFKYDESLFNDDSTMIFNMIHQLRMTSARQTFKCAPSKIKALLFILNCINDVEEKVQSSDIVSTFGFITKLNLSHNKPTTIDNKLTNENIEKLCTLVRWFKQLRVLDVMNNDITDEAKEPLAKIMLQTCTLSNLELKGNPIFKDKFSMAVFNNIKNVREKLVQSIVCNQENSPKHIGCHPMLYVIDCLSKLENPNCFKSFDNITTVEVDSQAGCGVKFLEYLNFLPLLKILKINNVPCITDSGMNQLGEYFTLNRTLTTLDLSYCNLKTLKLRMEKLENGITHRISLEVLKFNYSNITHEELIKFLNLRMPAKLNQLELAGNHFGDKGINIMHKLSFKNDKPNAITTLNLADNKLTTNSAKKIVEMVALYKVKHLNISNNDLGSIFFHLEEYNKIITLEELNISANNHQIDNAVRFANSIGHLNSCSNLKKLNISNNNIDDTATFKILCLFGNCTHFEEVICTKNPAENEIKLIFHLLKSLQQGCVKQINLKHQPKVAQTLISYVALSYNDCNGALATWIKFHVSQVISIDFSSNSMPINKDFICFLENCTQLEVLHLENNNITNETFEHLATGFLFNSKLMLSNLYFKNNPCMDNPKNLTVLHIIETLRNHLKTDSCMRKCHKCPPAEIQPFLIVLKLVDSVNEKQNDVIKAISLITCLDMNYSEQHTDKIQSGDVKHFCKYLKYFRSLHSLLLTKNNITEDAKDDLVIAILKHDNIKKIQLERNPIHKGKCFKLFETIQEIRKCKTVSYEFRYHPEALEALVTILQYIKDYFNDGTCNITNNIEELHISYFYKSSQYSMEEIEKIRNDFIDKLNLCSKLKTLNLSHARLTKSSLQKLSAFLQNNNSLSKLDVSYNSIQTEDALMVLESLNKNTNLQTLNLTYNSISGKKCDEIAKRICSLPPSINVDIMKGNKLTEESKKILRLK